MKKIKPLVILLVFLVLAPIRSVAQDSLSSLPDVTLKTLGRQSVQSGTFSNDDKPIAVIFWATWDAKSKQLLADLKDVQADWEDETGVKIIAVSMDDARSSPKVAPYWNSKGFGFEVYLDESKNLAMALGVTLPPTAVLLNGQKKVVWSKGGSYDGLEEALYEQIKNAVSQ